MAGSISHSKVLELFGNQIKPESRRCKTCGHRIRGEKHNEGSHHISKQK